jgi:hypothetical protein
MVRALNHFLLWFVAGFNFLRWLLGPSVYGDALGVQGIFYHLLYVIPFLGFSLIFMFIKKDELFSFLCFVMIGSMINMFGDEGNFSGAIFFVFAFHVWPSPVRAMILAGIAMATIAVRLAILEAGVISVFLLIAAYAVVAFFYYFLVFWKKEPAEPRFYFFDSEDRKIIHHLKEGLSVKEIAAKINSSTSKVYKRIKGGKDRDGILDKVGVKSVEGLIDILSKSGQMY